MEELEQNIKNVILSGDYMARKKKGNNYIVDEENNIVKLELHRRNAESFWTTIDLEDLDKVLKYPYTWYAKYQYLNKGYYVYASEYNPETKRSKSIFLHQFIMDANGKAVDHINGDTFDNRKINLRIAEDSDNSKNRKGKNSNNTSGYRNVSWSKRDKKWVVQMQVDKKHKTLGSFDDVHEAGKFAEEMRQKYYGEFAGKD